MASIFFFFALPAAIDFHLNFFFILGDHSQNREARWRLAPFSLPVAHNFLFFFGIDVIWWQGSGLIGRQGVKGLCHHTLIFVAIFRLPFFSISSSSQQLVFLFGNLLWSQRRWLANFGQNRCCFLVCIIEFIFEVSKKRGKRLKNWTLQLCETVRWIFGFGFTWILCCRLLIAAVVNQKVKFQAAKGAQFVFQLQLRRKANVTWSAAAAASTVGKCNKAIEKMVENAMGSILRIRRVCLSVSGHLI